MSGGDGEARNVFTFRHAGSRNLQLDGQNHRRPGQLEAAGFIGNSAVGGGRCHWQLGDPSLSAVSETFMCLVCGCGRFVGLLSPASVRALVRVRSGVELSGPLELDVFPSNVGRKAVVRRVVSRWFLQV